MNKRKITYSMFFILLFTLAVIGGSNQAAQALYSNHPVSDQELQEVETAPNQEELGLDQTSDTIDLWIVQDFEIMIYETAKIECHILSLYDYDVEVIIEVWIQYSNGSTFRIHYETKTLHPYLEYIFNVTHAFTSLGFHLVNLKVSEVTGLWEYTTECEWKVIDGWIEYTIFQEHEAQVGLEVNMTVFIQNGYAIDKYFYFEILLDDGFGPVQIYEDTVLIAAHDIYIVVIPWTFVVGGYYDVILRIYDILAEKEYFDYCYWEVYDGFIDIIIEQNYETWVGTEERIQFWVYNYYSIDVNVDIYVNIDNGTHNFQIQGFTDILISAGSYYMDEVFYTFLYEGYWDLYIVVFVHEFDIQWVEYCPEGWIVYGGFLDVWMYQRYEVFVLEEAVMYCWIFSSYAIDRDIAIEVWISNATDEILIYGESYTIAPGEVYNLTVFWTFLYADYWDVKLVVIDLFSGEVFVDYCWWYVYGGYFDLYIYQEYYGLVDEELWMRFELYNYYNMEKEVLIQILLYDGAEYIELYSYVDLINPLDFWVLELWHVFDIAGYYDILFIVTEVATQIVWIETCWWLIFEEYMDLWIIQDFTAQVNEEVLMEFYVFNYYSSEMDVTINVWLDDGSSSVILYTTSLILPANGLFNVTVFYTFLATGPYTIILEVVDNATGTHWFEYCYWRIFAGSIEVWIVQDYEAVISEEVWMQFYIESFYSFDVPIYVEVRIDTGYGIVILYSNTMVLLAYQLVMLNLSYAFLNGGIYQIYFVVVELQTGLVWESTCRWYVHDDGWFDIWIEQGYYGEVGQNYTMQFGVGNLFAVDKTLNLIVKIVQGSDTWIAHNETKLVLSMTTYSFYVYWIFYNEGWYDVYFIVTDVTTGITKTAECWWKIEEAVVVPEFLAMALIPIISAISLAVLLAMRRKRKILQ